MENHQPYHVAVVMVPFPVQSHLNSALRLSRLIATYKIPVYYAATTTHVSQVSSRVSGWDSSTIADLHFHGISLPEGPTDLKSMLNAALTQLGEPLADLVNKLVKEFTKVVLIFDDLMTTTVQHLAGAPNVESYCFFTLSAAFLFSHYWQAAGKPSLAPIEEVEEQFLKEAPSMEECFFPIPETLEFLLSQRQAKHSNFHSGTIFNTSSILEGLRLDLLEKVRAPGSSKHWAIGPINPVASPEKGNNDASKTRHRCLDWLDNQPSNSVIYVSFGTLSSLSDEQIRELASGLERSGHRFIWVLRSIDHGDISAGEAKELELPEGYEESVKERGIVVRDWAPQLEILSHSATGGFLTHCGWNSCTESILMGVPMATWPFHADQPINALLVTKLLKIGVQVKDWALRHQLVSSATVEDGVRRLMEGDEIRKRAGELRDAVNKSQVEGGATSMEINSLIRCITK